MRILLTILYVLGISLTTHASNTRLQSLPLGSDADIHRALTDQVVIAGVNIWTQIPGDVNDDGIPLWRLQGADSGMFPFSVDNGEIDYEFLRDQFTQFIDRNLEIDGTGVETVKFSTRLHLARYGEVAEATLLGFANEFYLERDDSGNLVIPAAAYQVEFNDPVYLRIPGEPGVTSVQVVYDMYGEDFVAYSSDEDPDLIQDTFFNIPLDAQREAREFGIPGRVILTYFDGEVREFDLDTGLRIGEPSSSESEVFSLSIGPGSNGSIHLDVVGTNGANLQVEYSQDLETWSALGTVTLSPTGQGRYVDTTSAARNLTSCFYRVLP